MTASFTGTDGQTLDDLATSGSETLIANTGDLSPVPEATPVINWQSGWRELDLVFGLAIGASGAETMLDPANFGTVPRDGVQLADVSVLGSQNADRIFAGVGSLVNGAAGDDTLFNTDSLGGNQLVGGLGADQLFLRAANDRVIGGQLFTDSVSFDLSPVTALADQQRDTFLIDSSDRGSDPGLAEALQILDYEPGIDQLLIDGLAPTGGWVAVRQQLQSVNVAINAAPQLSGPPVLISLKPGVDITQDLSSAGLDLDTDTLQLLKLQGPEWISTSGTVVKAIAPASLTEAELASTSLLLGWSDGKAVTSFHAQLRLDTPPTNTPPTNLGLANITSTLPENTSTSSPIKVADIIITDDDLGSNIISLDGADATSFEVIGSALFLKAGTRLDFESKPFFAISIAASDPSLPDSTPVSATLSLTITDVNESPGQREVHTTVSITLPDGTVIPVSVNINNADLSPGSALKVIDDLGLNASSLSTLAELDITSNSSGLDFQLAVDQGASASLSAALELIAGDLLTQLNNEAGRRADRKLLFYGVNATGDLSPLTYDPITGTGARFYDLDGNGSADFFTLSLIDGGYGDKDGAANGTIVDPSFAGFSDLSNLQFTQNSSGIVTISDPANQSPAAITIEATLTKRAASANQIGFVILNPTEVGSSTASLNDITWLKGRAGTLVSNLENNDVTLPANVSFKRDIPLINGQSLLFFEVTDGTLDELTSLSDSRFRFLAPNQLGTNQVDITSTSGVGLTLNLSSQDPGISTLISQSQGIAPVLDLTGFTSSQSLSGSVVMGREANLDSVIGFYRTLDANGTVIAADGITRLRPGDRGYAETALRASNRSSQLGDLSVGDGQTATRDFAGLNGGGFLAPFAQVDGNTFFAFAAANTDGISHFRMLGNNLFGMEDLQGGGDRDFDDLVFGVSVSQLA